MYSQNNEDEIVLNWFQQQPNFTENSYSLLDIGANDGKTFSNSLLLIENGFEAYLLEPSTVYSRCKELHTNNNSVYVYQVGIAEESGLIDFYESGSYDGHDKALLSCINPDEMKRWGNSVSFEKTEAQFFTFTDFLKEYKLENKKFDFISIDAEGMDWQILNQIDLSKSCTQCICVEWNSNPHIQFLISEYCGKYGFREIHRNGENLIFVSH
jgi:FkbM family methyltransferase